MSTIIQNKEGIMYDTVIEMKTIVCYKCAIPFAVPSQYRAYLKDTGETFHCPNGHSQHYSESTIDKLKKELEKEHSAKDRLWKIIDSKNETINSIERQKAAIKGHATRLKNRVKNGVCPCCNRTFSNLADHMKSKHPEFK